MEGVASRLREENAETGVRESYGIDGSTYQAPTPATALGLVPE
jgi:hypothetical protein